LPKLSQYSRADEAPVEADRGRAILNTRTIAVFDDGLVVCAVPVYGDAPKADSAILGS
jgi:hypothetical protein